MRITRDSWRTKLYPTAILVLRESHCSYLEPCENIAEATPRLVLVINMRAPGSAAASHDKARGRFFNRPRWRKRRGTLISLGLIRTIVAGSGDCEGPHVGSHFENL